MIGLYQHRDSAAHRVPAAVKLALLLLAGTSLFFLHQWLLLWVALSSVVLLFPLARLSLTILWRQLKPALIMLLCVFAAQCLFASFNLALESVLRLATLLLLAAWVTLTTRTSDLIDTLLFVLRPLEYFSFKTDKIALLLSLTITYIPLLFQHYQQLRDAQRARCMKPSVLTLVLPLLIQVLKQANTLAEAIDARAFNTD